MRIETVGTIASTKPNAIIKEIISEVVEKANLPEGLKYKVKDLSCTISFMVHGVEQALIVNHDGLEEIFTVKVALNEKGKIEKAVNNSTTSFLDEYTRATLKGEKKEYSETTSEYNDEDLELLSILTADDKSEMVYKHLKDNVYVLRYHDGNKLVGELTTHQIPQDHLKNMMK